jgi:hypothetical protein
MSFAHIAVRVVPGANGPALLAAAPKGADPAGTLACGSLNTVVTVQLTQDDWLETAYFMAACTCKLQRPFVAVVAAESPVYRI